MYQRILVPLDGSATAERGLREAIGLAAEHQATLHLMHVVDDFPMMIGTVSIEGVEDTRKQLHRQGELLLAKAHSAAREAGTMAETVVREVTRESIADAIVDEARSAGCDLIVMGTHGRRGLSRLTMGSDAELVVRSSPVPVLLVRQEEATA
ncbi:MAG TPA: universal stress protein [Albitalea sp.]|nr:universal stress protein [Albitalea sp.]